MAKRYLDPDGVRYLWNKIKNTFVQNDGGKVLSDNNFTTDEKNKLAALPEDRCIFILEPDTVSVSGSTERPVYTYTFPEDVYGQIEAALEHEQTVFLRAYTTSPKNEASWHLLPMTRHPSGRTEDMSLPLFSLTYYHTANGVHYTDIITACPVRDGGSCDIYTIEARVSFEAAAQDVVTESYINSAENEWNRQKWSSGKVEEWGTFTFENVEFEECDDSGMLYSGETAKELPLPSGRFAKDFVVAVSADNNVLTEYIIDDNKIKLTFISRIGKTRNITVSIYLTNTLTDQAMWGELENAAATWKSISEHQWMQIPQPI